MWLVLAPALGAHAAEAVKLSEQDRVTLTAKLHSRQVDARVAAVQKLAQFPEEEAVKLIIKFGLRDASDLVRRPAYDALLSFKDNHAICDLLIDQLNQQAKQLRPDPSTPFLLCVLLSSSLPEVEKSSLRYVNERLSAAR
ncbi:MAG TPA: HEAT repeat domain-containing protein, partial [Pirellulales bacterium]|nr:HEAT repeat domain-containing protein [Pirellulales bacterium]